MKKLTRYSVCFYDMMDGWTTPLKEFDDTELDKAKRYADKKMKTLAESNKRCGEHYGVIDHILSMEIYCTEGDTT